MSFITKFGKNISNKSKEITQKAKVISESSSLNNIIKGEECKIDSQYKLIGKMYFEKYASSPENEFEQAFLAIKSSMDKINETKQELAKIKSQFCCPSCGTSFKNGAVFCSKCGAKLPQKPEPEQKKDIAARICTQCGNKLVKDAIFCNVCGKKYDSDNIVVQESNAPIQTESVLKEQSPEEPVIAFSVTPEQPAPMAEPIPVPESIPVSIPTEVHTETLTNEIPQPQKNLCPNCKSTVDDDDIFCNDCGTKIK